MYQKGLKDPEPSQEQLALCRAGVVRTSLRMGDITKGIDILLFFLKSKS